jgi:predicted SprT family Zn-dependent metalloprotease
MDQPTPAQIEAVKAKLMEITLTAGAAAERHVFRTQTDFAGRMDQAGAQLMEADDAEDNGDMTDDLREQRKEALEGMAALCLARLALIAYPEIVQ